MIEGTHAHKKDRRVHASSKSRTVFELNTARKSMEASPVVGSPGPVQFALASRIAGTNKAWALALNS